MPGETQLLLGTPKLLILEALGLQPPHGRGVLRRVEQITLTVRSGSKLG